MGGKCNDCDLWRGWFGNVSRQLHCIFRFDFVVRLSFALAFGIYLYYATASWTTNIFVPLLSYFFGYRSLAHQCAVLTLGQDPNCRGDHCRQVVYSQSMTCSQVEAQGGIVLNWGLFLVTLIHACWLFAAFRIAIHFWCRPAPCHHRWRGGGDGNSCDTSVGDIDVDQVIRRSRSRSRSRRDLHQRTASRDRLFSANPSQPSQPSAPQQSRGPTIPEVPIYSTANGNTVVQPDFSGGFDNNVGGVGVGGSTDFEDNKSASNSGSITD